MIEPGKIFEVAYFVRVCPNCRKRPYKRIGYGYIPIGKDKIFHGCLKCVKKMKSMDSAKFWLQMLNLTV